MDALEILLLVIHVVSAVFIVVLVLLQPSTGDGSLVSSYGGNPLVSAKFKANLLTKSTKYIAIIFMINVLAISIVQKNKLHGSASAIEELMQEERENAVPIAD